MERQKIVAVIFVIALYIFSASISYVLFSNIVGGKKLIKKVPSPVKTGNGETTFDASLPKTEPCPLNGQMFSKQQKDWWEKHRPLTVMIENHEQSRPQSGLSYADVVYEAVAEGGITRLLVVYYCQDADPIGPVRSARTYYIDFASEYGKYPLYAHVGGANTPGPANALGQLVTYRWNAYNDLNQFSIGFPTFWRDYDRLGPNTATEHTMYSSTTKLWVYAKDKRKLSNVDEDGEAWDESFVPYTFKDDPKESERGDNKTVHLEFWEGYSQYFVGWEYDRKTNSYKRLHGGKPHADKNNGKQLTAKNIIVLHMIESRANDGYEDNAHLLYRTKGSGKATIFVNGQEIKGTWRKDKREARTLLFDSAGTPMDFTRGTMWFIILPTTGVVTVN